jgi:peptidoglycan/xylan/chitin deacetylase (PgdA/CDA1 family)
VKRLGAAGAAALAVQVLPAGAWLPALRRLVPSLGSPMRAGTVAVTFDDGPHPEGTAAVLDRLDELGWQAAFFMLGSEVARYPSIAREVAERGHVIGVHGFAHRYLLARSPLAARHDLQRAVWVTEEATGVTPRWWRPPYGVLSAAGLVAAKECGLRPLLWTAWGKDWRADATAATVTATIMQGRTDGGVVLLHDSDVTSAPGSWRTTVNALGLLAARFDDTGVRVSPLSREQARPRSERAAGSRSSAAPRVV